MLGIQWERFTYRSRVAQKEIFWHQGMRANDVALFLILLEKIGFECDANYLINLLKPKILAKENKAFTQSELAITTFEKKRHKHGELYLLADSKKNLPLQSKVAGHLTTRLGYRLAMKQNADGRIVSIRISSPKQPRDMRETLTVRCADCGEVWEKGDPDSSYAHRQQHKKKMRYLDPQPHRQYLREMQTEQMPALVTWRSPVWKHREMHSRALAFKREMQYDSFQWAAPGQPRDIEAVGYLVTNDKGAIIGAYCFRERIRRDQSKQWTLDWVWICPKYRRMGFLTKQWKSLKDMFGDFAIEPPVSDSMKRFLEKQKDTHLLSV
ncbi:hypothetical protein [Dyadobacter pollutisoli]|uniref:Uncharacterized protein n=1 Tax=Dyadobacter pollutisoli TaxID=2910158 RepID=A0A9E8NDN7_9BACT|nr:hypothetical protein [Dyadobacter pollutisoli]WAC13393.1 hypothetical protein ON006_05400 [Dyadobacter pollutisoli]